MALNPLDHQAISDAATRRGRMINATAAVFLETEQMDLN